MNCLVGIDKSGHTYDILILKYLKELLCIWSKLKASLHYETNNKLL